MTVEDLLNVSSRRLTRVKRLARALGDQGIRHSYMARQLKAFLAQQIRALRGDQSQKDFGERIRKPQSVVSRLEKQADRHISIQTLIDIAERLDIAVIIALSIFQPFCCIQMITPNLRLSQSLFGKKQLMRLLETQSRLYPATP